MRKQFISFAQVKNFVKYQAQGGGGNPKPPLRTPLIVLSYPHCGACADSNRNPQKTA